MRHWIYIKGTQIIMINISVILPLANTIKRKANKQSDWKWCPHIKFIKLVYFYHILRSFCFPLHHMSFVFTGIKMTTEVLMIWLRRWVRDTFNIMWGQPLVWTPTSEWLPETPLCSLSLNRIVRPHRSNCHRWMSCGAHHQKCVRRNRN